MLLPPARSRLDEGGRGADPARKRPRRRARSRPRRPGQEVRGGRFRARHRALRRRPRLRPRRGVRIRRQQDQLLHHGRGERHAAHGLARTSRRLVLRDGRRHSRHPGAPRRRPGRPGERDLPHAELRLARLHRRGHRLRRRHDAGGRLRAAQPGAIRRRQPQGSGGPAGARNHRVHDGARSARAGPHHRLRSAQRRPRDARARRPGPRDDAGARVWNGGRRHRTHRDCGAARRRSHRVRARPVRVPAKLRQRPRRRRHRRRHHRRMVRHRLRRQRRFRAGAARIDDLRRSHRKRHQLPHDLHRLDHQLRDRGSAGDGCRLVCLRGDVGHLPGGDIQHPFGDAEPPRRRPADGVRGRARPRLHHRAGCHGHVDACRGLADRGGLHHLRQRDHDEGRVSHARREGVPCGARGRSEGAGDAPGEPRKKAETHTPAVSPRLPHHLVRHSWTCSSEPAPSTISRPARCDA